MFVVVRVFETTKFVKGCDMLEDWTFERAFPPPTKKEAVRFPVEYKPVRVPRLVMFGCAACVTTRAPFALMTFPETEDPWTFERVFARILLEETIPKARFEAFSEFRPAPLPLTLEKDAAPVTFRVPMFATGVWMELLTYRFPVTVRVDPGTTEDPIPTLFA